jgi:hypothetical protein
MITINLTPQEAQLLVSIVNIAPINGTFGQRQELINVLLQVDQLAKKLENPTAPDIETVVE